MIKTISEHQVFAENKDFYKYIMRLQLVSDNEILVLPARKHFFYTADEVSEFKAIVNLNKLNYISKLKDFVKDLKTYSNKNMYFFGCFIDNKHMIPINSEFKGTCSNFFKTLRLLIDRKMKRLMSPSDVTGLFNVYGFEIVHMQKIRCVTYFYATKKF